MFSTGRLLIKRSLMWRFVGNMQASPSFLNILDGGENGFVWE